MTIMNCGGNAQVGGLPDPTSANAGDVLTLDSNKDAVWQAPSGGGITAHSYSTFGELVADYLAHWKNCFAVYTCSDSGGWECTIERTFTDTCKFHFYKQWEVGATALYIDDCPVQVITTGNTSTSFNISVKNLAFSQGNYNQYGTDTRSISITDFRLYY